MSQQLKSACDTVREIRNDTGRWPNPQQVAEQLDCPLMLAGFALARVKRAENREQRSDRE